jgi:hypothetical protein
VKWPYSEQQKDRGVFHPRPSLLDLLRESNFAIIFQLFDLILLVFAQEVHFLDFIQLAGYGSTVKPVLVILPPGVVTFIEPEVAPVGTTTKDWPPSPHNGLRPMGAKEEKKLFTAWGFTSSTPMKCPLRGQVGWGAMLLPCQSL